MGFTKTSQTQMWKKYAKSFGVGIACVLQMRKISFGVEIFINGVNFFIRRKIKTRVIL